MKMDTRKTKKKDKKVKYNTSYNASYSSPKALYNLGSGSWLAWANDTAVHYAIIHCQINKQLDLWFAASRHTTAPISHIRPSPCSL